MNVEVTPLPGIGVRKDFPISTGQRVGVINHLDGDLELIVSHRDDPDTVAASLHLSVDESAALSNLLGAPQLAAQLRDELPGLCTKQLAVTSTSPFDGRPLGDTEMRRRTGVSVVAVMRAGQLQPSPAPDFTLTAGDLLVAVGTGDGIVAAGKLLKNG